jgi:U3 small nucleolar RNA-associated protein 3
MRDSILTEPETVETNSLPQDKTALLKHLAKTSPETLALSQDWDETAYNLAKTKHLISECVLYDLLMVTLLKVQQNGGN